MRQWRNRPCIWTLAIWKEFAAKRARVRTVIQRTLFDRTYSMKRAAMLTWKVFMTNFDADRLQDTIEEYKETVVGLEKELREQDQEIAELAHFRSDIEAKNHERGVAVLWRLLSHALQGALQKWKDHSDEHARQESLMNRFVAKWKLKPARQAIVTWRILCSNRRKTRHVMMRAFADRSYKQKYSALNSWKAYCQSFSSDNLQASLEKLGSEIETLNGVINGKDGDIAALKEQIDHLWGDKKVKAFKTMSRMINAKLVASFSTWSAFVKEQNYNEMVLRKFVTKMKLLGALKCLRKWRDYKSTRVMLRNKIKKNIFCKSSKLLAIAFRTWMSNGEQANSDMLEHELRDLREEVETLRLLSAKQQTECDESERQLVAMTAEKVSPPQTTATNTV